MTGNAAGDALIEGGFELSEPAPAWGHEIRKLRKARGKTLAELALATGRSPSFLSQLERGNTDISITDLRNLAAALGVPLGWFFTADSKPQSEVGRVVRADSRRRLGAFLDGITEELLSPDIGGRFEMFLSTFAKGATRPAAVPRDTEEEIYVVKGQFDIWIDDDMFSLKAGDSFRIVHEPYRWVNTGDTEVVVVWVIAPPIY
ncbi:helix-turn-helix domain-containing protein [Pseudomonas sp. CC120222-01a]|uniref:helix-turn-helix domain-containing protein n=1 Tax=Pseudomonas sp. CC120222-01a TaxID=1378075 RepID=UPI000D9AD449|nr:XRE family transcriptional regulator [Pseudomonas sp. CC120222-01a]PVZ41223.1 XRE family transcriptional regulator [Pseudomonas sp. CC120222-01a]